MAADRLLDPLRAFVRRRPLLKRMALAAQARLGQAHHAAARMAPALVRPRTSKLTVAITAACNQRCMGCRYGRDFMVGERLSLAMVEDLLDDAQRLGVRTVRLYGGEPLLHPDLPAMVERAVARGLRVYVTTNGTLLEQRIDELHAAGLRDLTLGYYGSGAAYDDYAQRRGCFHRLLRGLQAVRERYGDAFDIQLNYLLRRQTCDAGSLDAAWELARRFDMKLWIDLVHYSLPYFTEGPDRVLQFRPEDRGAIEAFVRHLVARKRAEPERLPESELSLWSIPDWLLRKAAMRVPCDAYRMVWIGADGSVQLCYVTFPLGNLHDRRLRDLLYTPDHERAARGAFQLDCPNCHCGREQRILRHGPSRRKYGGR